MVSKRAIVIVLVLVWAAVFVGSFFAAGAIEGPRNIDTGLKRLDVLAVYQLIAVSLAVVAAILGLVWRRQAAKILLIGLLPVTLTVLAIFGIFVLAMILGNGQPSAPPGPPTAPASEATQLPTMTQN